MILCRCVDSLISPPPLSPRKSPQYLHFVFKPFFCSRSTYPICCVYLWVSPQLSIYGRAVHQYFSLVSCCCQIGRVCFSSPKYRDCKKLIPEAQITILSRAHSVFFTAPSLFSTFVWKNVPISKSNTPNIRQYLEPLPSIIQARRLSRKTQTATNMA